MTDTPIEAVPLEKAVLCEDCRQITAATNGHCQMCGSTALMNLAKVLQRDAKPPENIGYAAVST